ncbi:lysylphosphatidylglycerol synthase transmembrane domain-containing protein [Demequina sp.]|uniref:lysylphosphatidylglycerol synthase transmembrane domain-containing protein n=1 Tax=Demequina sp. TaxID=2050685 RepID=UPI003D10EAD2
MAADADATARAQVTPASGIEKPQQAVQVIDSPLTRVHRFTDLISLIATSLGIALTLLISAYAQETSAGITEDIQGVSSFVQRLLVAPVNIISGIITIVIPGYVIIALAIRKEPRRILEIIGASVVGFMLTGIAALLLLSFASEPLLSSLSIRNADGTTSLQLPAYISAVSAMVTASGTRLGGRTTTWSWTLLWVGSAIGVVTGIVTAPAAILTILIGRVAGLAARYAVGSNADRAYGDALVDGIRRAGFEPRRLVRADATNNYTPEGIDPMTAAIARSRAARIYAITTRENHHLIGVAIDGDQHAAGFLTKLWGTLRLRGINTRADVSLRASAQATALVSHAARTAGVRTSRVLGMAAARDTFITVYQRPPVATTVAQASAEDMTDAVLDALWNQVEVAHSANIAHRNLSSETVLVSGEQEADDPSVWLTAWDLGEVAASDLAIRIDRAQVLAMLATKVGVERALASAFRCLSSEEVEQFAPLIQPVALPGVTRAELKAARPVKLLEELREGILNKLPDANVDTQNITRFGARTIITAVLAIVAIVVMAGFNTTELITALRDANLWWLLAALVWSFATYVGAALTLMAFSPVRLPFISAFLAQVAATYVALAAPAGVGPAALNMRMLSRRGVATPLGLATVALIQVSSVVVTVIGLVTLTLLTGSPDTLANLPSTAVLIGVGITIVVLALALLVPRVRKFALGKVMPVVSQTWPRLSQVLSKPWRLGLGLGGNLLMTVGYIGAFYASLEAFGQSVKIVDLAIVFFIGNAVGAVVPTPGGVGPVELALTAALTSLGIPYGVAFSAVLIYRFITHFLNIPLGYISMKYLERKGEV